tara:strand:- start:52 stop:339 length:288 start_codon:yes stop_codon:yes gene_type:complete
MIDQAIYNTHPSVVSILESTDAYDEQGDSVVLDMALVNAEVTRLQAAYDAQAYSRLRKVEYNLLNQDEMRYDDLVNGTTTWQDAIAAIKLANPKP